MKKLTNQGAATDEIGVGRPVFVGLLIVAVFFGGIMGWAALAPLGSAAIASGVISVEGNRKSIQHLEGGIVDKILVKDGDFVEEGQILLTLEKTQAQASIKLIYGRKMVALAEMAWVEQKIAVFSADEGEDLELFRSNGWDCLTDPVNKLFLEQLKEKIGE